MWQYNYNIPTLAPDELMHYGVLGMKWGHRKAQIYAGIANYHQKRAASLQSRANEKRSSFMNTNRRKINYATKEQRYANAEKFHNKKALGLSYGNKLFGNTLDYKYNKSRAAKDSIMKEKYSEAKTGTTNKVNRLEYRAGKHMIKANKALLNASVGNLQASNATKASIDKFINERLGNSVVPSTWRDYTSSYGDSHSSMPDYVRKKQLGAGA